MNANGVAPLPLEQSHRRRSGTRGLSALCDSIVAGRNRSSSSAGSRCAIGPVASPPWSTNTSWSGRSATDARSARSRPARHGDRDSASREVTNTTATRPARVASPIASPASIDPTSEPSSRDAPDAGTSAAPVAGDAHAMSARHHSEAAAAQRRTIAPGAQRRGSALEPQWRRRALVSEPTSIFRALFASRRE